MIIAAAAGRLSSFTRRHDRRPVLTCIGRYLPSVFTGVAALALAATLIATMYFTNFDVKWVTFLGGVLFAAILSLISQTVKAQWLLLRRNAQLARAKERTAEEVCKQERAVESLRSAESRFRSLLDALPVMLFLVDREGRCRQHNRAVQTWHGSRADELEGRALTDIFRDSAAQELAKYGADALVGTEQQFESDWPHAAGAGRVNVKLVPQPPGAAFPTGYYVIASPASGAAQEAAVEAQPQSGATEAMYYEAMERIITPDANPREFLLSAIEQDQFTLFAQPIQALSPTAGGAYTEILLRLREEAERILPPGGFLEVAERHELMSQIDRWVVRTLLKACSAAIAADSAWRMPLFGVTVSSASVRDPRFAAYVCAALEQRKIPAGRLCIEISHNDLVTQEAEVAQLMTTLKPLGCRFALDGFGSQKISFVPFRTLQFDFFKIDGSIVTRITRERSYLAKAHAISMACQRLGVRTVAQSVEDEETRVKLISIGIDYAQGFAVAAPEPLSIPGG